MNTPPVFGWESQHVLYNNAPLQSQGPWENIVDYARQNLPLQGTLMANSDGFVYLKVDDKYINTLFPLLKLKEAGFRKPPYFRREDSPGAHISVFYVKEHVKPTEVGQTFHFSLKDVVIVNPSKRASYAILQVDAPELEALREKYGVGPKLFGHEFHISLAKKVNRHKNHRQRQKRQNSW